MIRELFGTSPILYGLWAIASVGVIAVVGVVWAMLDYLPGLRLRDALRFLRRLSHLKVRLRFRNVTPAPQPWRLADLPASRLEDFGPPIGERRPLSALMDLSNRRAVVPFRKGGR